MSTSEPLEFDETVKPRLVAALRLACEAAHVGAELYNVAGSRVLSCSEIGIAAPALWAAAGPDGPTHSTVEHARHELADRARQFHQPHLFDVAPGVTEAIVPLFAAKEYVGYLCVGPVRAIQTSAGGPKTAPDSTDMPMPDIPVADRLPRMTIRQFRSFLELLAAAVRPCLVPPRPTDEQPVPEPAVPPVGPRVTLRPRRPPAELFIRDLFVMARYGRVRDALRAYVQDRLDGAAVAEHTRSRILTDILLFAECCTTVGAPSVEVAQWTGSAAGRVTAAENTSAIERIIDEILSYVRRSGRRADRRHAMRLRRIVDYIERHVGEPLTAREVGAALGLSQRQISDCVKAQTGGNYRSLVTAVRIARARRLLERTELSVVQIARRVGYPYESYFSRVFTQHIGEPPTRFRQRVKGSGNLQKPRTVRG